MKLKPNKNITSFMLTVAISSGILLGGNQLLVKAGLSFTHDTDHLTQISTDSNISYVFYSQLNDDLTLYPWIYYSDAVPFTEFHGTDLTEQEYNDSINLYESIRYLFYKMIPDEQKKYITSIDSSLKEIMDYDHMEQFTKVKLVNNRIIYFFEKDIAVGDCSYHLAFAYRETGSILSFQCKKAESSDSYTPNIMRNGKSNLNQFLEDPSSSYLNYMLYDMFAMQDLFTNYSLKLSNQKDIDMNMKKEYSKLENSSIDAAIKDNSDIFYFSPYQTYQLVETKDELMIILLDSNIVVHYDPVNNLFNGFNISSE